jgi:positive regulator of sigma E activity
MKKQQVIFQVILYEFKWIALVVLTILFTTEVHSDSKKIIMFLLIGFIAVTLILEGRRDFRTKSNKTTSLT